MRVGAGHTARVGSRKYAPVEFAIVFTNARSHRGGRGRGGNVVVEKGEVPTRSIDGDIVDVASKRRSIWPIMRELPKPPTVKGNGDYGKRTWYDREGEKDVHTIESGGWVGTVKVAGDP